MTAASVLLALALIQPAVGSIRSDHHRILKAIEEARRRSVTFQRLVDRLSRPDLIIYVEPGRCTQVQVLSCVTLVAAPVPVRYLRVTIDTTHSLQLIELQIAHELQHAVEIADAPEVVDVATLRGFYSRIGETSAGPDVFETASATATATQVLLELHALPGVQARPPIAARR